jgi:hypothetical protein
MLLFKLRPAFAAIFLTGIACSGLTSSGADTPAPAKSAGPRKIDFSDYKLIADRNIFNPRRHARSSTNTERRETTRPVRIESFTLVGSMSYEKGWFAFFDSANSEYRKTVQPSEKVGAFTVAEIAPMHVVLTWDTNVVQLRVGMQMRREDGGDWHTNTAPEPAMAAYTPVATVRPGSSPTTIADPQGVPGEITPFPGSGGGLDQPPVVILSPEGQPVANGAETAPAGSSQSETTGAPEAGGTESDVLRRLMQRREQELNK